jgi:hypothetical protein
VFGRRKKQWIHGTARVVGVNRPPHAATHSSLTADVVVEAPGLAPYATEYKELVVSISKWPSPGSVLPVLVNPKDHTDLDVRWDEVKTGDELSREQAERLAEALRSGNTQTGLTSMPGSHVSAETDVVAQLLRMFPDAQVTVGSESPAPPDTASAPGLPRVVASHSDADPVERLEKLAALHASGIVDDAQFAALRDQILGQAGLS